MEFNVHSEGMIAKGKGKKITEGLHFLPSTSL